MVVTFYSYKGGVGRSMAMANIARWFQLLGLNVVVVDWDLEAPGLESFYSADKHTLANWRSRVGLVDLLTLYRQDFHSLGLSDAHLGDRAALRADVDKLRDALAPLRFSLLDIPVPAGLPAPTQPAAKPGMLRLLSAGWREGPERFAGYANAVQAIDWTDFYSSYRGDAYIEWLRESLCEVADIVLVDSRTGVTEMGGVCTRHMADVVVVLSAPNRQNIEGATMVARGFVGLQDQPWRERRPIQVVMVPSRIDIGSRSVKSAFEPMFREHAAGFMPEALHKLGRDFWDLRIPYVDDYAFEEKLAVGERGADPDLESAYKLLAAHIGWLAPGDSRVPHAMRAEFDRVFGAELVRAQLDVAAQFDGAWSRVPSERQPQVRELLLRLVQVGHSAGDGDTARNWRRADAAVAFSDTIMAACGAGLVKMETGSDGTERVALADPAYVTNSQLTAWLRDDRVLLAWRQRLRTYLDDWVRNGREPGGLLQGSVLDEAELHAADRSRLLADELDFIAASRRAADVRPEAVQAGQAGLLAAGTAPAAEVAAPARLGRRLGVAVALAAVVLALGAVALYTRHKPGDDDSPGGVRAAAEVQVADGKRLAESGNFQGAIDRFEQALQIDANSVDALVHRADARAKLNETAAALADLNRAAQLAPRDARPWLQRARLRAEAGDAPGALADLAEVERAGGELDLPAWKLRARLLAETGAAAAALAAYGRVVELGAAAEGQIGKAQILERTDRKDEAVAAYRVAIESTSDTRLRTLAEARLKQLVPDAPPVQVSVAQASLHLTSRGDAPLAELIGRALAKVGVRLPQGRAGFDYELVDMGTTRGDVRYFFDTVDDKSLAKRTQIAVQDALAAQGFDRTLTLLYVNPEKTGLKPPRRGSVEIWLPAIASVRGMRFEVFACERSGPDAMATAEQVVVILKRLEAIASARKVAEADRVSRFGLVPTGFEIRPTKAFANEQLAATMLTGDKDFAALGNWRLVPVLQHSVGYMSIFVCPEAPRATRGATAR